MDPTRTAEMIYITGPVVAGSFKGQKVHDSKWCNNYG